MSDTQKFAVSDVNNMKIWAFYIAQKKWNMNPSKCVDTFEKYKLFECIENGYDYMHLMSYKGVVEELEEIINTRETTAS